MKNKLVTILAALALLCLAAGCTTTTYRAPNGASFSRTSFLNKQAIGKVDFGKGSGADAEHLTIEGYSNEQTEVAAAVAAAVVKAMVLVPK